MYYIGYVPIDYDQQHDPVSVEVVPVQEQGHD